MAKANAVTGTTYYVAEGAPLPAPGELHPDVRLVGPGAPEEAVAVAQGVSPSLAEASGQSDTNKPGKSLSGDLGAAEEGEGNGDSGAGEAEEAPAYEEWTNDDLRAELEDRGLSKSGNKDELVARLEDDDLEEEE